MSRHGNDHSVETRDFVIAACLFGLCLVAISTLVRARDQDPGTPPTASAAPGRPAERLTQPPPGVTPGVPMGAPEPELRPGVSAVGPIITPEGHGPEGPPALDPKVQVVRFQGPSGLRVEVLAPEPSPVSIGDGEGIATVGLQRGVGYRLRLSDITERPGVELFPVIEVVGHLHRPREISPAKYPIRIVFTDEELWDVVDRGRLVTKVIYLEEPEQAIPIKLSKDQIPVVTLNPTEQPLKVAEALGRVMAIVRIGGRRPTLEEINAGATGDLGLDAVAAVGAVHCPFTSTDCEPCQLPCGPACGTLPPAGRPWLPRDEYLCDGGDQGAPAGVGEGGNIKGIDPRDAVMRFDVGLDDRRQPRVLPTNRVCVYAPRFAEVRISTGTNEAIEVHGATMNRSLDKFALTEGRSHSRRLVQNQAAELTRKRRKPALIKEKIRLDGIKSVESTVMTGLVEGPGQTVMSWQPHEMKGVETPPQRPGMAIIKRVSATEAEPGDTLTFTITYRNMGNTPIRAASVVDSLLPRIEYVKGSAKGPKGTVFSSAENRVGSSELKWELPGVIPPGASGEVSFQAVVR